MNDERPIGRAWVRQAWQRPYGKPKPDWTLGECRRHAPSLLHVGDGHTETKWPKTHSTDFCGEFAHLTLRAKRASKFIAQLLTRMKA